MKCTKGSKREIFDYTQYSKKVLFGPIFWIHMLIEVVAWLSPFLINWWIVVLGAILLQGQFLIFGGCVLNRLHFKKHKDTIFLYPYLRMIGIKTSFKNTRMIMRYVVPVVVIGVAIFWQVILGHPPLFNV